MVADIRHDWTRHEVLELYARPLLELVFDAQSVHRRHHDPRHIQRCTLLSVKTGGCPEDCSYCPQSAHHASALEATPLMAVEDVLATARAAREAGASRFCMGAAWRSARRGPAFDDVLAMVRGVRELGMEACVTLGMLSDEQAQALADAGLSAYNHNLDTSAEHYGRVITTRTYEERLETLQRVADAGVSVCSGGILGLGETDADRAELLRTLANLTPHPESVPVNTLVRVAGTPLAEGADVDPLDVVRAVAVARILMPAARVRLSAGREALSREAQALCFLAGANSIFFGDKLLTTPNPPVDEDTRLLGDLGLVTI
ncbi:MAG: biotin synthase BioB [Deltaproteobacteria bacterium]|nr:biotin synthase BioB [Deltaproteobacteria bacterium]MCB9787833.1 biotin synthase BioB [Deltaproteobacteria bacterium]